jgi:hypothetical protein
LRSALPVRHGAGQRLRLPAHPWTRRLGLQGSETPSENRPCRPVSVDPARSSRHQRGELRRDEGLRPVAQRMRRIAWTSTITPSAPAPTEASTSGGTRLAAAGRVARVDHDRQARQLAQHRHGREVRACSACSARSRARPARRGSRARSPRRSRTRRPR